MLQSDKIIEVTSLAAEVQRLREKIEQALNAGDDRQAILLDASMQALEEMIAEKTTLSRIN